MHQRIINLDVLGKLIFRRTNFSNYKRNELPNMHKIKEIYGGTIMHKIGFKCAKEDG